MNTSRLLDFARIKKEQLKMGEEKEAGKDRIMLVNVRGKRWWGVASSLPLHSLQVSGEVVSNEGGCSCGVRRRNVGGEGGRSGVREDLDASRCAAWPTLASERGKIAARSAAEVDGFDEIASEGACFGELGGGLVVIRREEESGSVGKALHSLRPGSGRGGRRSGMCGPMLLSVALLLLGSEASAPSQAICPGGVPCVVEKGGASFDNSEYITTAGRQSQNVSL